MIQNFLIRLPPPLLCSEFLFTVSSLQKKKWGSCTSQQSYFPTWTQREVELHAYILRREYSPTVFIATPLADRKQQGFLFIDLQTLPIISLIWLLHGAKSFEYLLPCLRLFLFKWEINVLRLPFLSSPFAWSANRQICEAESNCVSFEHCTLKTPVCPQKA